MKKLIAMTLVFAVAMLVAAYLAIAPLAAPGGAGGSLLSALDAVAAAIIDFKGRSPAVLGSLALGVILALLAGLLAGARQQDGEGSEGDLEEDREGGGDAIVVIGDDDAREAAAARPSRSAPPSQEARLAALRQRASNDSRPSEVTEEPPAPVQAPAPAPAPVLPGPVLLVRKPREPGRDWFGDTCWFGGLPRLGAADWPRDDAGRPMTFIAQIDLAAISAAQDGSPLPASGAMAYFLGSTSGAVVFVAQGEGDFSDPPADLPPAFDEDGAPFPAQPSAFSKWFFPFWPVELRAADIPEALRSARDPAGLTAADALLAREAARIAPPRDHPFYAFGVGAPVETLWWHGAQLLAHQFRAAFEAASGPVAARREMATQARAAMAQIDADPAVTDYEREEAREDLDAIEAELAQLERQWAAMPQMVEALEGFVTGRDPWAQLSADELGILQDLLPEAHEKFGELVADHVAGSLAQLATLSLRTMISGPGEALAGIPAATLERINREYRQPPEGRHQIFGPPAPGFAGEDGKLMLLQLAWDDMMEWRWGEQGIFRFWISPEDAAAGNWSAASVTFSEA